jgi:site-specific DNA-methyltransferase (adenine-specific)
MPMNNLQALFTSQSDEWATPQDVYDSLDAEFHFTLDPCATDDNHKCEVYYTIDDNGLLQNWGGADSVLQSSVLKDRRVG